MLDDNTKFWYMKIDGEVVLVQSEDRPADDAVEAPNAPYVPCPECGC